MEQYQPRAKVPYRVSVSNVHALLNNWEDRPIDFQSAVRMWRGTWKHKMIQELLTDYQHEIKKEIKYKSITLVGMIDCLADDHGLEIKTSELVKDKAKEWEVTQAKLYATMFEVPHIYIVQPVIKDNELVLKKLRKVGRNDEWFYKTLETINTIICQKD